MAQWRGFIHITSCSVLLYCMHGLTRHFKGSLQESLRVTSTRLWEQSCALDCSVMAHQLLNLTVRGLWRSPP